MMINRFYVIWVTGRERGTKQKAQNTQRKQYNYRKTVNRHNEVYLRTNIHASAIRPIRSCLRRVKKQKVGGKKYRVFKPNSFTLPERRGGTILPKKLLFLSRETIDGNAIFHRNTLRNIRFFRNIDLKTKKNEN